MQLFLEPLRQPAEKAKCSVQKNTTIALPPPRVAPLEGPRAELFPPWFQSHGRSVCLSGCANPVIRSDLFSLVDLAGARCIAAAGSPAVRYTDW